MITIRMFFKATPGEYGKIRVAPKDFYGVLQITEESIRKENKDTVLGMAKEELRVFGDNFTRELIRYWKRLHHKRQ